MGRSRRKRKDNPKVPHPQPPRRRTGEEPKRSPDTEGRRKPDDADAAELARLREELRGLAASIGRAEERADAAAAKADALLGRLHPAPSDRPGADPEQLLRIRRGLEEQRRILAARGTDQFVLLEEGGKAIARINGKRVVLSPTQAVLLEVLAWDNGQSHDQLIGWKTTREVGEQVSLRLGRVLKPGALRQNVLRLRQRLDRAGVDRFLIQSRGSQMRFALRRSVSAAGRQQVAER